MTAFRERLANIAHRLRIDKFKVWAEQLYSPRELRALRLFCGLGVAVLLYRFGNFFYLQFFPGVLPHSYAKEHAKTDSLFLALSAKARSEDSLIFALPEDSLIPLHERARSLHKKGSLLMPHSIALNTAAKLELMELPAVGPATADLILNYRQSRGNFRSIAELRNVKTIGPKRLAQMAPYLRLN